MIERERPDGTWGIYTEVGEVYCAAVMPDEQKAKAVVSRWDQHQREAEREWAETLRSIGSPGYGLGIEQGIDETMVLRLGGRLR